MKISLALIVAPTEKEAKRLDHLLNSVESVFDEICVTQAGPHPSEEVSDVIKKHKGKESFYKWHSDFAAARNHSFEQCTGDWIVWFDSDDIVQNADKIRENIKLADDHKVTGLSTLYHYAHDEAGLVKDSHWKLQMVKAGHYTWKGVIHEDLIPIKEGREAKIHDVIRVHTANDEDSKRSLERNKIILEQAIKDDPSEPRNYFYAARSYLGTEEWEKVVDVITTYLTLSDWPAERYDAMNMMGEAYMRMEDYSEAIKTHQLAILELEDAPDAYIYKARNYLHLEKWADALTNLEIAAQRNQDSVILKRAPLYDHDLFLMTGVAWMNLGEYQRGLNAINQALKNRESARAIALKNVLTSLVNNENLTKTYRKLGEQLIEEPTKLRALLSTVPDVIKDDPRLLQLQFSAEPPKEWPDNSIVWYCGNSLEDWDGNSIKNGGIGGSETAVIEIAKRQAKAGHEVTVFNRCGAEPGGKVIDGVTYRNFWEYDQRDHFNTIILWRTPQLADFVQNAKKVIVDMHDVSNPTYFTQERLDKIDEIRVKTEYHRSLYPEVPDEKFIIVGNGINPERFEGKKTKKPNRFIYTSSPNRGLENILDVWSQILKKVEEPELHVFYGWKSFVETHKNDPAKMQWVEQMKEKMNQKGIINHGRVGQDELAKEMMQSSLWLYPTEFAEIHCITALEMQAAKVYPITTGYAALQETQKSGVKLDGDPKTDAWKDKFVTEIVYALENPDLLEKELDEGEEYAKSCSWDNVAKSWH